MRPFDGKRVLVGVAGGIAAYKTAELVRLLVKAGAEVQVILTENGAKFVGPTTFEALTGKPVHTTLWEGSLRHIELGREADAIVVAPATANVLAKLAAGIADDLLTTTLLAAPRRALLVPAMNTRMHDHPATQVNLARLGEFGHTILGPEFGELAEREEGWGRMSEASVILTHVGRLLEEEGRWWGRHVVVTSGPTYEPVDAVRFIGNRSSGRMGHAIAAAAWRRGAEVRLIHGPTQLQTPHGIEDVRAVETAEEMRAALSDALPGAAALFMVAAVSDFRPTERAEKKIRRSSGLQNIAVEPAPDLMTEAGSSAPTSCVKVAFAVELADGGLESARAKLERKGAHIVVVNDPSEPGSAFGSETNRVTIVYRDGEIEELPRMLKSEVADAVLDRAERYMSSD